MSVLCIEELTEADLRILAAAPGSGRAPSRFVLPSAQVVEQVLDEQRAPDMAAVAWRRPSERPS